MVLDFDAPLFCETGVNLGGKREDGGENLLTCVTRLNNLATKLSVFVVLSHCTNWCRWCHCDEDIENPGSAYKSKYNEYSLIDPLDEEGKALLWRFTEHFSPDENAQCTQEERNTARFHRIFYRSNYFMVSSFRLLPKAVESFLCTESSYSSSCET